MPEKIIINPVTRISGFMEIEADIENNIITGAKTKGLMFRGFEKMLAGRNPFDSIYFSQRICGICSSAHAVAAALALEDVMGLVPSEQGKYLRDFIHGCEFLQSNLRHFFQYALPDYIRLPESYPLFKTSHLNTRLPQDKNEKLVMDYFASLEISRSAHQMLAILGGKAPHNHGVFIGGITTQATADKIIQLKSILHNIGNFVRDKMIPDIYTIASYYPEYHEMGRGYGNLLSYGCFNDYQNLGNLYVYPLVYSDNKISRFNPEYITEEIETSWYRESAGESFTEPDPLKENAYTFVKAPRYNNIPYEVGPLARQWLSGEYRHGISAMDRLIARVLECRKIVSILQTLVQNMIPDTDVQQIYTVPERGSGKGLHDTCRGALGHWVTIDNSLISSYQIISPSTWNLSSQTNQINGVSEQALLGTHIRDIENPVEIVRIIRSYDPCVSCATHVYQDGKHINTIQIV